MDFLFVMNRTPDEILQENKRAIDRAIRDLEREKAKLEQLEVKLTNDIRKNVQASQMDSVKIMAKDLVRTKSQMKKISIMRVNLQTIALKTATLKSQGSMASAMRGVTQGLVRMNRQMNLPQIQRIIQEFQRQTDIVDMTDDILDDVIDDVSEDDNDEIESDLIVNQVLGELDIDMNQTLSAPHTSDEALSVNKTSGVQKHLTAEYRTVQQTSNQPPLNVSVDKCSDERRKEALLQIRQRSLIRKTEALKSLCEDQKQKLKQTKALLADSRRQLDIDKKSNRSKEGKIDLIKRYITSRKASVQKRCKAESELLDDMKQRVTRRIFQLTADIFTIEEVNLSDHQTNSFVNMETSPLLTFSDGSYHQIEQETAFSIVEPWLPSNGDYSAYGLWVDGNQEPHISMSNFSERNPASRIAAGLAYTTHLVRNLAFYLGVILPAKIDHDIFYGKLLDDTQFSYNVAKLNANVIHLCVSQGVDISLLHPRRTIKNLMLLFNLNISNLGGKPIMELTDNDEVANKIKELECDLSLIQEDFYDLSQFDEQNDDVSDSEWEISGAINPMEMQMATEQSLQQNSYISRLPTLRLLTSLWG